MKHSDDYDTLAAGCAVFACAGVASHLLYFIRGDHNAYAHRWILRSLTGVGLLSGAVFYRMGLKAIPTAVISTLLAVCYFTGLFGSISLYRLFFHPLGHFPGPFWARLSNLTHVYMIRGSDNYLLMQQLHKKYGPIVRTGMCTQEGQYTEDIINPTGPSNLSINDPDAIRPVLSNASKCTKSPWYSRSLPLVSLHTVRDKKAHDARRKVFSMAFSPTALNDYEKRVVVHCEEFVRQMEHEAGKPFNASDWFKYFGNYGRHCCSVI